MTMLVANTYGVNVWIWVFKDEFRAKNSKPPSPMAAMKVIIERLIKPVSALNDVALLSPHNEVGCGGLLVKFRFSQYS
jgi:hypothetical protein